MVTMKCPHCESKAVAKSISRILDLVNEIAYRCDDDHCGHSFVAEHTIVLTMNPPKNGGRELDRPLQISERSKHARGTRQS